MSEFITPPNKELNEIMNDNKIVFAGAPAGVMIDKEAIDSQIKKWIADINEREEQCLKTIHARYCIPRALHHNAADVSRYYPVDGNKNLYQYWYKFGTPQAFMLMQRELVFEDNQPKLNIVFNADLAREGE